MSFLRFARCPIVKPNLHVAAWNNVRTASTHKADLRPNLIQQASEIFRVDFNPKDFLLTHATIIASVDTEDVPNVRMGAVVEDGIKINRKYSNYRIKPATEKWINNNKDSWDRPVLLKSYRTFVGGHNFQEHVQIEELSKGRIIDAVARDIGESVYVDILIATDRNQRELVASIMDGRMDTLSMGCSIDFSVCTRCGHVAADETQMCRHIKYEKGNHFFDRNGQRRMVAELCGHHTVDPTGGVHFIEASWVETPAFTGAVLRNVLEPHEVSAEMRRKAEEVLSSPPPEWSYHKQMKAAQQLRMGQFDLGDEGGGEEEAPPPPTPMEQLEERLQQHILRRVEKKIKEQMAPDEEKETLSPENSTTGLNNTIIKEAIFNDRRAAYRAGLDALVKIAASDVALVDHIARYNQRMGIIIPVDVYRAVIAAGPTSQYKTVTEFLRRCAVAAKRDLTLPECKTLIRLGKLLEARQRISKDQV